MRIHIAIKNTRERMSAYGRKPTLIPPLMARQSNTGLHPYVTELTHFRDMGFCI